MCSNLLSNDFSQKSREISAKKKRMCASALPSRGRSTATPQAAPAQQTSRGCMLVLAATRCSRGSACATRFSERSCGRARCACRRVPRACDAACSRASAPWRVARRRGPSSSRLCLTCRNIVFYYGFYFYCFRAFWLTVSRWRLAVRAVLVWHPRHVACAH